MTILLIDQVAIYQPILHMVKYYMHHKKYFFVDRIMEYNTISFFLL